MLNTNFHSCCFILLLTCFAIPAQAAVSNMTIGSDTLGLSNAILVHDGPVAGLYSFNHIADSLPEVFWLDPDDHNMYHKENVNGTFPFDGVGGLSNFFSNARQVKQSDSNQDGRGDFLFLRSTDPSFFTHILNNEEGGFVVRNYIMNSYLEEGDSLLKAKDLINASSGIRTFLLSSFGTILKRTSAGSGGGWPVDPAMAVDSLITLVGIDDFTAGSSITQENDLIVHTPILGILIYPEIGINEYGDPIQISPGDGAVASEMQLVDLNGQGSEELVYRIGENQFAIHVSTTFGEYLDPIIHEMGGNSQVISLQLDQDEERELLFYDSFSGDFRFVDDLVGLENSTGFGAFYDSSIEMLRAADVNGDGIDDFFFARENANGLFLHLVNGISSLPFDLNGDGIITIADLIELMSNFGCVGENCLGDLNNDGIVNIQDLILLLNEMGG
jgi:hypothetical protein